MAQKVAVGVYKGVTTSELDELAAETSASMTATHPDYALVRIHEPFCWQCQRCTDNMRSIAPLLLTRVYFSDSPVLNLLAGVLQLAARIAVSNLHKNTLKSFSET